MFDSTDIYHRIDFILNENGFAEADNRRKKELVLAALRTYTMQKILESGLNVGTLSDDQNLSLEGLLQFLDSKIASPIVKDEFFSPFSHCLINIASNMQSYVIDWRIEDDIEPENLLMACNNQGQWNSLKTNIETEPINITLYLLESFKNHFLIETGMNRQRTADCENE